MIKTSALSLFLFASSCFAGALSEGRYKGSGLWNSEKDSGYYSVVTEIEKDQVAASYELPDGSKKKWVFNLEPSVKGFFKVKTFGLEIGSGYCLDKTPVCHYEIEIGKFKLEETLALQNNKLYRFGSKEDETGRIFWQEDMDKL